MALPGATWQQLLQGILSDFQRLDLLTQPTPLPSDIAWLRAQESVAYFQPDVFVAGQNLLQWVSTFGYQKLYALPADFEIDGQIAFNVSGQNYPIDKISEYDMNRMDSMIPAVIGPSQYYCIYGTAANLFSSTTATWQAGFDYSGFVPSVAQTPRYLILDSNGNVQALQSVNGTGISSSSQPVWPLTLGATVIDGDSTNGAVWQTWFLLSQNPNGPVLRLFPTPDNVYQMTAIYQRIIPMPTALGFSNFWTVEGQAMVQYYADYLISKNVAKEPQDTYQRYLDSAEIEFVKLSGIVRKQSGVGHARAHYL